jgi:hypothetical protein
MFISVSVYRLRFVPVGRGKKNAWAARTPPRQSTGARRVEASPFSTVDLNDFGIVDNDLDDAKPQRFHILLNDIQPCRLACRTLLRVVSCLCHRTHSRETLPIERHLCDRPTKLASVQPQQCSFAGVGQTAPIAR